MNNDALNGVVEVLKAGNGLTRSYVVSQVASRGGQVFATVTGGIGSFSIDVTSDMLRGKSLESAVETRITSYSLAYAAGMLSAYVVGSLRKETSFDNVTKYGSSIVWQTINNKGESHEDVKHTELYSNNGVKIIAGQGIVLNTVTRAV